LFNRLSHNRDKKVVGVFVRFRAPLHLKLKEVPNSKLRKKKKLLPQLSFGSKVNAHSQWLAQIEKVER
jgi:hypothetical protein